MVRRTADGPKSNLAHADYYDVWSGIFRNSFFGEQANWAKAHNVEYLVHLNHEEGMLSLENSEGDYFRDERYVEVPGIDNLSQLIPSAVHRFDEHGHEQQLPQTGQLRTRICSASRRCGRKRAAVRGWTASTR